MAYGSGRLPSRFPVGTKFVIEGKRGGEGQVQVFSRYLEFPDGTFFPTACSAVQAKVCPHRTACPSFARPLNRRSANGRDRAGRGLWQTDR